MEVRIKGVKELQDAIRGIADNQIPFATALALTNTASKAKDELVAQMDRDLDRPTPFTKGSLYVVKATKAKQVAMVKVRPVAERYLAKQVFGGAFPGERNDRLKLPSEVNLNEYGNISKGLIKQLIQRINAGKRITKKQSERLRVSRALELFYGEPDGWPLGIYKRTPNGLIPVIVFPKQQARYTPRYRFFETGRDVAGKEFERQFRAAFVQAVSTAKQK